RRGRSSRRADDRGRDRQDSHDRRPAAPGGGNRQAPAGFLARVPIAMKTPRQVKREARELWQVCLQDGLLDEARARLVVDQIAESQRAAAVPPLKPFLRRLPLGPAPRTAPPPPGAPPHPAGRARTRRAT